MKFSKAEVDAIIEASPRTFVPFNKLLLSEDHQARSATAPVMSLPELAASIKDSGVLQNLVVVQAARGRYEVCAGGRRLAALTLLVQQGDIADNYPVPVLVVPADKALIASLAENCFHVPMHPADKFAAFARLLAQGKSVEDVAAAFGVTPLIVKRRMKLATVSPQLMALYREGGIGLDCLMVLASVDDHQRQEQAWAGLPSWNQRPEHLRQLLTRGEIESDADPLARFVTVKAYEKAGGPLRRDLFSDDDRKAYLLDPALLERLAADKLVKRAKQLLSEGWKWVDIRPRFAYDEYVKHGELRKPRRAPTPEEGLPRRRPPSRHVQAEGAGQIVIDRSAGVGAGDAVHGGRDQEGQQPLHRLRRLHQHPVEHRLGFLGQVLDPGDAVGFDALGRRARLDVLGRAPQFVLIAGRADRQQVGQSELTRDGALERVGQQLQRQVGRQCRQRNLGSVQQLCLDRGDAVCREAAHELLGVHGPCRGAGCRWKRLQGREPRAARRIRVIACAVVTGRLLFGSLGDGLRQIGPILGTDEPCLDRGTAVRAHMQHASGERHPGHGPFGQCLEPGLALFLQPIGLGLQGEEGTVARRVVLVGAVVRLAAIADALAGITIAVAVHQRAHLLVQGSDARLQRLQRLGYLQHVSKARVVEVVHAVAGAKAAGPLAALKKDAAVAQAEQLLAGHGWLPDCLRVQPHADAPVTGGEEVDANEPARTEAPACA